MKTQLYSIDSKHRLPANRSKLLFNSLIATRKHSAVHFLILFLWTTTTMAAPDYTDLLYEDQSQEDTVIIMTSHISNGYRFDLLSPLVMTDYGGSNINTPYGEEAVHGTFMVVTSEETGEVAYFKRDEEYELSKGFIFKNQLTEESLKELQRAGIDPDQIDIMI